MKRSALVLLLVAACGGGSSATVNKNSKVVALTSASPVTLTLKKPEGGVVLADEQTLTAGTDFDATFQASTRQRAAILAGITDADKFDDLMTVDVEATVTPQSGAIVYVQNDFDSQECDATFGASLFGTVPSTCLPELLKGAKLLKGDSIPLKIGTDATSYKVSVRLNPGAPEGYAELSSFDVDMPASATFTSLSGTLRAEPTSSLTQTIEVVVMLIVDFNGDGIATLDERYSKVLETKKDVDLATWLDEEFAKKAITATAGKKVQWTFIGAVRGTTNLPNLDSANVALSIKASATVGTP